MSDSFASAAGVGTPINDADAGGNLTGIPVTVTHGNVYNGTTWDRIRSAIGDAMAALGLQAAANMVYNGGTWDRVRGSSGVADANAGIGVMATGNYAFNGTTWDRVRVGAPADAIANSTAASHSTGFSLEFNGTTWDRMRNSAGVVAASSNSYDTSVGVGSYVKQSLGVAAAVVAGASLDNVLARNNHSLTVSPVGAPVGVSVNLELSNDGANWFPVTPTVVPGTGGTVTGNGATGPGMYVVTNVPARYVRANLTAITSGTVTAIVTSY